MESISGRIRTIIDKLDLSDSQFADKCGISRATLSMLLSGKNKKISDILLSQIHEAFPNVSILWILFNEGEMFVDPKEEPLFNNPKIDRNKIDSNEKYEGPSENDNFENANFVTVGSDFENYPNLIPLNSLGNIIHKAIKESFNDCIQGSAINEILIKNGDSGKKVKQVTIYYDDSTFETFVPESKTGLTKPK